MGLFKKRTTKSVGTAIGQSIERTKEKEKILRTLEKEKEQRGKERKVTEKIRTLKREKPTGFRKFSAGARRSLTVTAAQIKELRRRAKKKAPVKRRKRRTVKRKRRKSPVKRRKRRTRTIRRATPRPAPKQEAFVGFRF